MSKSVVEFGSAIERLRTNPDFKKVIITGYLEQEAVRLVHLKADSNMQTEAHQLAITKQIDAIGALNSFLMTQQQLAGMAQRTIASCEEAREELLAEGDE